MRLNPKHNTLYEYEKLKGKMSNTYMKTYSKMIHNSTYGSAVGVVKSDRIIDKKELISSLKNDIWVIKSFEVLNKISKDLSSLSDNELYNDNLQLRIVSYFPLILRDMSVVYEPLIETEELSFVSFFSNLKIWYYIRKSKKVNHKDYILNKDTYKRDNKFDNLFK